MGGQTTPTGTMADFGQQSTIVSAPTTGSNDKDPGMTGEDFAKAAIGIGSAGAGLGGLGQFIAQLGKPGTYENVNPYTADAMNQLNAYRDMFGSLMNKTTPGIFNALDSAQSMRSQYNPDQWFNRFQSQVPKLNEIAYGLDNNLVNRMNLDAQESARKAMEQVGTNFANSGALFSSAGLQNIAQAAAEPYAKANLQLSAMRQQQANDLTNRALSDSFDSARFDTQNQIENINNVYKYIAGLAQQQGLGAQGLSQALGIQSEYGTPQLEYIPSQSERAAQAFASLFGGLQQGAGTISSLLPLFSQLSDRRIKEDIKGIEGALSKVKKMNGVKFKWNDKAIDALGHFLLPGVGVIAQDIEQIDPELVIENNGYKQVYYYGLIGYLIESIKTLSDEIEKLKNKE